MRKIYVVAALLLLFLVQSFGQITLVKTIEMRSPQICKFTNTNGTIGFTCKKDSNIVDVYNEDFSFNRTITLNVQDLKEIVNIGGYNGIDQKGILASSHLFNSDDALEFVVVLRNTTTGQLGFAIVSENNNILFTKNSYEGVDGNYFYLFTSNSKIYLFVDGESYSDYTKVLKHDIYSLPGTERFDWCSSSSNTSDVNSVISKSKVSAFPNPSKTTVNLSYSLPDNSKGTLSVYDLSGKCLKTMKVDGAFPYVTMDVTNYAPATYIYKVESNGTSVSEKFIVSK